eukprot:5348087-Prymnesium_polylepis.2
MGQSTVRRAGLHQRKVLGKIAEADRVDGVDVLLAHVLPRYVHVTTAQLSVCSGRAANAQTHAGDPRGDSSTALSSPPAPRKDRRHRTRAPH